MKDKWICVYCGLDGRELFEKWLSLSEEHLLPKEHPHRNDPRFVVTACAFCNVADNQYFNNAAKRRISFDGKTPEELISLRKPYVKKIRSEYQHFWENQVRGKGGAQRLTMKVASWSNGSPNNATGAGYSVRISKHDRAAHFNKAWNHVEVDIPGAGKIVASLSPTFWTTCPEIRNKEIGKWLLRCGLAPWPKGLPPSVNLTKIRGNRFKLHR